MCTEQQKWLEMLSCQAMQTAVKWTRRQTNEASLFPPLHWLLPCSLHTVWSWLRVGRRVGGLTGDAAPPTVRPPRVRPAGRSHDDEAVHRQSAREGGRGRRRQVQERLTGPPFLGSILVCRTDYPVNRLTVNIPSFDTTNCCTGRSSSGAVGSSPGKWRWCPV